jgi:hypothetical protein
LDPGGRVHRYGFVGSPVTFRRQRAWLRVSPFLEHEMSRKAWRGTVEAAAISRVSKPALLHRIEWQSDGPGPVPVSAEVLTLVTDPVVSRERFLRTAPDLLPDWFGDLTASLAALRAYPTDRRFPVHDAQEYGYLLSATYRNPVPAGWTPAFGTEHIDLNWNNITAPHFCILDMEHWCVAVTGDGAAYLYLTALEVPAVADRCTRRWPTCWSPPAAATPLSASTPAGREAQSRHGPRRRPDRYGFLRRLWSTIPMTMSVRQTRCASSPMVISWAPFSRSLTAFSTLDSSVARQMSGSCFQTAAASNMQATRGSRCGAAT